ncbi:ABC transporter permease [Geomesophilobacter sediminis]|uniref:ABC transporter permease n=1 Tax=Geomesophilobacter sediminis TaxID=2798584 RepID=A0A8J7JAL2_9BACT|nr:ABC transporter permease [Geomesophilobacter sediminis]MBJ6723966.1 ABC transporter permease [Geomesophilobacter sediminis]
MILWRAAARHLLRHPWQTVLAVLGVALGVAVVTAVDLANETARRAFTSAAQAVAGKATHQVVAGPAGIPEELYRSLRLSGIRECAPMLTAPVQTAAPPYRTLQLVGIDPFAEAPVRSYTGHFSGPLLETLVAQQGSCLLLQSTAAALRLRPGQPFTVESGGRRVLLTLAGYLDPPDAVTRLGLDSVLVVDIATAQEVLSQEGRLTRIDLVLPEGEAGARELAALEKLLPRGTSVVSAGARAGALDRMTRAFRLNLTALSLLALVVGMFLIYNTMTFSVITRRSTIGMLRALGVTRREVCAGVLGEAFLLGSAGTVAGLLLGSLLARELTRLVTRTINDLYFTLQVTGVHLYPETVLKGVLLGVGATLAAALPPALEATGAPPRAAMARSDIEETRRRLVPWAALAGALLMAAGGGLFFVSSAGITGGFAALFAVIIGYALTVPGAVLVLSRLFRPLLGLWLGVIGKMAARGVVVSLSRTGVAAAALVVAVSATIGVGIMVGSFRDTVQQWLGSWLRADVYLRVADRGNARLRPVLDPGLVRRVAAAPGAAGYTLSRRVSVEGAEGATEIFSLQMPKSTFIGYRFKEGDPEAAWGPFSRGEAVVVSEPYAYRHHLTVGRRLTLATAHGPRSFGVAGVFYDYGTDAGIVMMSRGAYLANWDDPGVDGMSFYARPGVSPGELVAQLRRLAGSAEVFVISNAELRRATVQVFDRTFAITGVLRLLTLVVACIGILAALMALQVERARELAVMRALGLTPAQVWGTVIGETALIGILSGILSVPLGIIQALVLIYVVNLRSFGWTMELSIDPLLVLQSVALALVAAVLGGIYPSLRIARSLPALALKEE